MKKYKKQYRIIETIFADGTKSFQPQYYLGDESLKSIREMGYLNSDGWINVCDESNTYRKALLKIRKVDNAKIKVTVLPNNPIIDKKIHTL